MFQHHDGIVQKSLRYLLVVQFVALIPLGALAFLGHATLALYLLLFTLIVGLGVLLFAYARYGAHPIVVEKRSLIRRKTALESKIRAQQQILSAAEQKRSSLRQAEQAEAAAALQSTQRQFIEDGLRQASIADADIPGVGPKLKERLAARAVITAADVNRASVSSTEGFGEVKIAAVLNWRQAIQIELDNAKPGALAADRAARITAKYRTQHAANDEKEASAQAAKLGLENDLASHLSKLEPLADITFRNYLTTAMSADPGRAGKMAGALLATTALFCGLMGLAVVAPGSRSASAQPTLDYAAIGTSAFETAFASNVQAIQASSTRPLASPTPFPSTTVLDSLPTLDLATGPILPVAAAPSPAQAASAGAAAACIPNNPPESARVVDIVDGDTIKVVLDRDGKTYSLRYIGMDTAEMNPPGLYMAAEAKARNAQLAYGKTATLVKDVSEVDRFGRLLRYVVVDNVFINYQLVAEGFARAVSYPPDTACIPTFQTAEQQAYATQFGLWAAPSPVRGQQLVMPPTAQSLSAGTSPSTGGGCCKHCGSSSQPCGNSCISSKYTCSRPPGCACP